MKIRILAVLVALLLAAVSASAAVETVLTSDSTVYTIDGASDSTQLTLTRRTSEGMSTMVVPSTDDEAIESQARLLWDGSSTLFVLWHRRTADVDEIRLARLTNGEWSQSVIVAGGASVRRAGLQVLLARAEGATLIHAVWWSIGAVDPVADYALVAFEGGEHVSTESRALDAIVEVTEANDSGETEDTGRPLHPPLAMARAENGVDIVYGRPETTAVRRIRIEPRKIAGEARAWRPLGKSGTRTGRARMISTNDAPVQAFLSKGRIVLYTPDAQFRFMVYDNGQWSPLRMIQLDETLTSEQMLQHLRKTVDELLTAEAPAAPDL